jgi:hypothetical protein
MDGSIGCFELLLRTGCEDAGLVDLSAALGCCELTVGMQ